MLYILCSCARRRKNFCSFAKKRWWTVESFPVTTEPFSVYFGYLQMEIKEWNSMTAMASTLFHGSTAELRWASVSRTKPVCNCDCNSVGLIELWVMDNAPNEVQLPFHVLQRINIWSIWGKQDKGKKEVRFGGQNCDIPQISFDRHSSRVSMSYVMYTWVLRWCYLHPGICRRRIACIHLGLSLAHRHLISEGNGLSRTN